MRKGRSQRKHRSPPWLASAPNSPLEVPNPSSIPSNAPPAAIAKDPFPAASLVPAVTPVPAATLGESLHEPVEVEFFLSESDHETRGEFVVPDSGDGANSQPWYEATEMQAASGAERRRAELRRYVAWAVGGAGIVCVLALVQTSASSQARGARSPSALTTEPVRVSGATVAVTAATAAATAETAAPEMAPESQGALMGIGLAPHASDVGRAIPPREAREPREPSTDPDPLAGARKAKKESQRALEAQKLDAAIVAGESSVSLDPTDAEAWLILGAAYQEKGDLREARRSYSECVRQGKRGPRAECSAMLR